MAAVSELSQQDSRMDPRRYRFKKFPSLLSEVQTGGTDQSTTISYHTFEKARRQDAELNLMETVRFTLRYFFFERMYFAVDGFCERVITSISAGIKED